MAVTIPMAVTMAITLAVLLGMSCLAANYLWSLPYAPACPACRSVTSQPLRASRMDGLLARRASVSARHCPRCGWSGRMRWRLAAERATRK